MIVKHILVIILVCLYVCTHTCVCVYIYIYTYIHTYIHTYILGQGRSVGHLNLCSESHRGSPAEQNAQQLMTTINNNKFERRSSPSGTLRSPTFLACRRRRSGGTKTYLPTIPPLPRACVAVPPLLLSPLSLTISFYSLTACAREWPSRHSYPVYISMYHMFAYYCLKVVMWIIYNITYYDIYYYSGNQWLPTPLPPLCRPPPGRQVTGKGLIITMLYNIYIYIYTHIHTYIHAYIHTYIHTYHL